MHVGHNKKGLSRKSNFSRWHSGIASTTVESITELQARSEPVRQASAWHGGEWAGVTHYKQGAFTACHPEGWRTGPLPRLALCGNSEWQCFRTIDRLNLYDECTPLESSTFETASGVFQQVKILPWATLSDPLRGWKGRCIAGYLYFCPPCGQQTVAWGWSPEGA